MNRREADELITLINSFVEEEKDMPSFEEMGEELSEFAKESGFSEEPKVELTDEETKKLFRGTIPEGFSFDKADLVRNGTTGDKVWLRFNETKRWIPDLDTLERMGYSLGDVHDIKDEEMKDLKEEFGLYPVRLW